MGGISLCVLMMMAVGTARAVPSYVVPGMGVAFESQDVAVHTLNDAYTTLAYHIPKDIPRYDTTGCGWVDIQSDYRTLSAPLWDLLRGYESLTITKMCEETPLVCGVIPTTASNATAKIRNKRFIPMLSVLAGFAGVGMAVRNNVRISEMTAALTTIKSNQDKVASFVDKIESSTKYELHKLERLIIARSEETRQRLDKMNAEICTLNVNYARAFLQISSRMMVDEAYAVVERAQSGFIDPRMIPLSAVNDMASPGGPLEGSIYSDDPGLFYSLTTPYLVGMEMRSGLLYYLLQTPRITRTDISPIYRVFNYGYYDPISSAHYKLALPDHFYMLTDTLSRNNRKTIPVPIDPSRCVTKGSFLMCRHEVPEITNKSTCLQALMSSDKTQACSIVKALEKDEHVLHATRTAVLVRGEPKLILTDMVQGIPATRTMTLDPKVLSSISYKDFSVLSVAGHTILSPHSPRASVQAEAVGIDTHGLVHLDFTPDLLENTSILSRDPDGASAEWGQRHTLSSQLEDIKLTHSLASGGVVLTTLAVIGLLGFCLYALLVKRWKRAQIHRYLQSMWMQKSVEANQSGLGGNSYPNTRGPQQMELPTL